MKIFTRKLVIYDNGWRFEWEERDPMHLVIPVRELTLWVLIIYLLYFR